MQDKTLSFLVVNEADTLSLPLPVATRAYVSGPAHGQYDDKRAQ